jgi:hypothetical protein
VIIIVAHLDMNCVSVNRGFSAKPLGVKQEDAAARDDHVVDVALRILLAGATIR